MFVIFISKMCQKTVVQTALGHGKSRTVICLAGRGGDTSTVK